MAYRSIPLRMDSMVVVSIPLDWIGKDTHALVAVEPPEQETGSLTRPGACGARRRGGGPWPMAAFRSGAGVKMGLGRLVAHARSLRDNYIYRASFTRPDRPVIPPPEARP